MIWLIDKVYIGYSISSLYYQLNWNSSIIGYVDDKRQYSNNQKQVCLTKITVDFFMFLVVASGICCEISYDCILATILDILVLLIEFVFNFVLT